MFAHPFTRLAYAQVEAALDLAYALVEGCGVKAQFDARLEGVAVDTGAARVELAPLKGRVRALEKCVQDYSGDVSRLWDIVRGSIVFYSEAELRLGVDALLAMGAKVRKDRIEAPLANGYRDVMMDIVVEGVHCEVQLHLEAVIAVKERYHGLVYEVERSGGYVSPELYAEEKAAYEYAWEVSRG